MPCDHLGRPPLGLLLLAVLWCVRAASAPRSAQDFQDKVSLLLREEPENPKCFSGEKKDFTCFWEEDEERAGHVGQYSFTYAYRKQNSSRCPLWTQRASDGKRLFVCHLNRTQMFVPMDIRVYREGALIHNRSLLVELVFLLDPPGNLSVSRTEQDSELRVSWVPPSVKYMDDSMMYEVRYDPEDSSLGQVEEVWANSEVLLRGLSPRTRYKVRARVKLDGISYNGYWSAWTEPVTIDTPPAGIDLLLVSLVTIISLVVSVLSVTLILSHRRFIKKKLWPPIPNPESKFQGLFTVHGGDFRAWLGHTNGSLWLRSVSFYSPGDCPSPLEILSELSLPSPPLSPKASRAGPTARRGEEEVGEDKPFRKEGSGGAEAWQETPHDHWLMEQLRAFHRLPTPSSQSSLQESQDTYVTLNAQQHASTEEEHLDDIMEEGSPLEVLFASQGGGTASLESRSDLGSMQQSSGSGRLSSGSSFEYPNHTWAPKGPGYTYMAVADSGVSMDYSPMSSSRINDGGKTLVYNEYKNELWSEPRPVLTRQVAVHTGW